MGKSTPVILLRQLIAIKESENEADLKLLKQHFVFTYESLKPMSIVKSTLAEVISAGLTGNVVNAAIGLISGVVMKKVLNGKTNNPLTKFLSLLA
jgi:hypothetical protein